MFYQIYSIHAYDEGLSTPCIFALLADKQESTYNGLLYFLKYFLIIRYQSIAKKTKRDRERKRERKEIINKEERIAAKKRRGRREEGTIQNISWFYFLIEKKTPSIFPNDFSIFLSLIG